MAAISPVTWVTGLALFVVTKALNAFFDLWVGGRARPVFFDIDRTCPSLRVFDRHLDSIRAEFDALLAGGAELPRYHDIDPMQHEISDTVDVTRRWNVFMLHSLGVPWRENQARCPRTAALLDEVDGLFQAFFSILEAGKSIPAHEGIFRGYLRYHLPLRVPAERPPSIRIHDTVHTWRDGESVLFDDSWEHEVYNDSAELRAVLIVDVLRPMPWLPALVNRVVKVLLRVLYVHLNLRKF